MKASNRYTWFVGVVALAIVVYITINTLRTGGHGSRGLQAGDHLPVFAAPLATGGFAKDADADVGGSKTPPCRLTSPGALNVCALRRKPVVLAFFVTGKGSCRRQLDTIERVKASFPQVNFAAVAVRASRPDVAPLVRRHGWTFPVAYDHDGAVGNLYDVVVCPTVTFAYAGGRVMKSALGTATTNPSVLATDIRALLRTGP